MESTPDAVTTAGYYLQTSWPTHWSRTASFGIN